MPPKFRHPRAGGGPAFTPLNPLPYAQYDKYTYAQESKPLMEAQGSLRSRDVG